MITLPNDRTISTLVLSTALGIDGGGLFPYTLRRDYAEMVRIANATDTTRFSKSVTRFKRKGNFRRWNPLTWKYIQNFGFDGKVNAYGLTNKGIKKHAKGIAKAITDGIPVIPNFFPDFSISKELALKETLEAIAILQKRIQCPPEGFWAFELSYSCPNVGEDYISKNIENSLWLTKQVNKEHPKLVLIAKISVAHPSIFAKELFEAGASIIHSANTVPWSLLFSDTSPLAKYGKGDGGVSGGPAFEKVLAFNQELLKDYQGPIIFGCGIVDDEKLGAYINLKNKFSLNSWAISICTAALQKPEWVSGWIKYYN